MKFIRLLPNGKGAKEVEIKDFIAEYKKLHELYVEVHKSVNWDVEVSELDINVLDDLDSLLILFETPKTIFDILNVITTFNDILNRYREKVYNITLDDADTYEQIMCDILKNKGGI